MTDPQHFYRSMEKAPTCLNCRVRTPEQDNEPIMHPWYGAWQEEQPRYLSHCRRCKDSRRRGVHTHWIEYTQRQRVANGIDIDGYPKAVSLWPLVDSDTDEITGYRCLNQACGYTDEVWSMQV